MTASTTTADVTAPTLKSLDIPKTIDLSKGAAQLTIAASASDDLSEIRSIYIWFDRDFAYSFSLGDTSFINTSLLGLYGSSDSWEDGASRSAWAIAATNSSDSYNVARVEVVDQQGNTRTYYQSDLKALGVNTAIEFKGSTPDVTAPTLTSLVIPSTVDLSKGAGQLSIAATATDDSAGVKQMHVWFDRDFAYSSSLSDASFINTSLLGLYGSSDSWEDGASKSAWAIAATNSSDSYNVARVEVVDQQGNSRTYYQAELKELGFNTIINFSKGAVAPQPDPVKVIQGTDASETLHAGAGHEVIDGAGGLDTVVLHGNRADYVVAQRAEISYELHTWQGYKGELANVERLHFDDTYVALDLLPHQAAGQTALLIGSLVGSAAVEDNALFGEVLAFIDANGSQAATDLLVQSGVVASLAGGSADQDLFALLWRNLLGAEAPQQEIDGLIQAKQALGLDQAEVLDFFLQLELTATSIGLVGLAQEGVEYLV